MTTQKRLDVSQLDFDGIKQSFKTFLRDQGLFTDFDFEGSGMNILLDVLALNAHHHGFYTNMVANETFLDSAAKRKSITSIAKHLGYVPRSIKSAKAQVNVNFGEIRPEIGGNIFDYLSTGTVFRSTIDGDVFNFITKRPYKLDFSEIDGNWFIKDIVISEGVLQVQNFIYNSSTTNPKFAFFNNRVDTESLVVRVQTSIDDSSGFSEIWNKSSNFSVIDSDSRVYFLEEKEGGQFQIYFGDGILGRSLRSGNYITVQSLSTRGPEANGIGNTDSANERTFQLVGFPKAVVSVKSSVAGGSNFESSRSIKFTAPLSYQAQNRAVTSNDYRAIITAKYGQADSVFVYGGEEASPPQYGKVFISIKPISGSVLTDLEKTDIARNILSNQNVLGITPEVIDPDYIYLLIDSSVVYDPTATSLSESGIESLIVSRIRAFGRQELEKFDKNFYFSFFTGFIDDANPSILGNESKIILEKRLPIILNVSRSYSINFNNEIFHPDDGYKPVLFSSPFTIKDDEDTEIEINFDDDGFGNIRTFRLVNDRKVIVNSKAGLINYARGKIEIFNITPIRTDRNDAIIKIRVEPENENINTIRNMILLLDPFDINVRASQKVVFNNSSLSGIPFPFNT